MTRPTKPQCRMTILFRRNEGAEWEYGKSEYASHKRDPDNPGRCVRCQTPMRYNYQAWTDYRQRQALLNQ